ncbi:MAG: hypothetical protein ACTSVE_01610 [Candidatus Helarchaeota archaeon]
MMLDYLSIHVQGKPFFLKDVGIFCRKCIVHFTIAVRATEVICHHLN